MFSVKIALKRMGIRLALGLVLKKLTENIIYTYTFLASTTTTPLTNVESSQH